MGVVINKGKAEDGGFVVNIKNTEKPRHITRRELEVLSWIVRGLGEREVAEKLDIKYNTVRNHIHNLVEKLGAKSRENALLLAVENEMIEINRDKSLVGWLPEDYLFCIMCERAFLADKLKVVERGTTIINHVEYDEPPDLMCPYEGCKGNDTVMVRWDHVRKYSPELPEVPEENVRYEYDGDAIWNDLRNGRR